MRAPEGITRHATATARMRFIDVLLGRPMLTRWHHRCSEPARRCAMLQVIAAAVLALLLSPGDAPAQTAPDRPAAGINRETGSPGSAGPKDEGVVQRGSQPNPGEVRPGNR